MMQMWLLILIWGVLHDSISFYLAVVPVYTMMNENVIQAKN